MKTITTVLIMVILEIIAGNSFGQNNKRDSIMKQLISQKVQKLELECQILSEKEAEKIMGNFSFIGSVEVEKFINRKLQFVPQIPFSREELFDAKKNGMILILQFPLTMIEIEKLVGSYLSDGHLLFYQNNNYWYKEKSFYKEDKPIYCWNLVTRDILPQPIGKKNLLIDVEILVSYIKANTDNLPEWYKIAIEKFYVERITLLDITQKQKQLSTIMQMDLPHFCIEAPVEIMYRIILYQNKNNSRLFVPNQALTCVVDSGQVVSIGEFDNYFKISGLHINHNDISIFFNDRGFTFSRKF